jgi:hypothetical protein
MAIESVYLSAPGRLATTTKTSASNRLIHLAATIPDAETKLVEPPQHTPNKELLKARSCGVDLGAFNVNNIATSVETVFPRDNSPQPAQTWRNCEGVTTCY